jgi:hypothetical protein
MSENFIQSGCQNFTMSDCQNRNWTLQGKFLNQYQKHFRFSKTVLMGDMEAFLATINSLIPTVMANIHWGIDYANEFYWNFDASPVFNPTADEYAAGGRSGEQLIFSNQNSYWVSNYEGGVAEFTSTEPFDGGGYSTQTIFKLKGGCVTWYLFPNFPINSFVSSIYKAGYSSSVLSLPEFMGIPGNTYNHEPPKQFLSLANQIAPTVDIDGTHPGTQIELALADSTGAVIYYPPGYTGTWSLTGLESFSETRLLILNTGNQAAGAGGTGSAGGGAGSGGGAGGGAGGGFDDQL